MAISSLGAGSGLDLNGILNSLMAAEQQPLIKLQTQEASYQARISALGSLNGALSALQTAAAGLLPASGQTAAEKYTTYSATVADSAIASASASKGAVAGTYALEVSKLAQNQRLATATPGTPPASPYANADAAIGEGTLAIKFGELKDGAYTVDAARTLNITIDSTNNTLGGLRDAINAKNGGVTATIINGTAGAQLVLTAKESGNKNVMQIEAPDVGGLPSPLAGFAFDPVTASGGFTQDPAQGGMAAQDAEFKLNGIAATSSTNSISGVLEGVTLTLSKVTEVDKPTRITVSTNTTSQLTTALTAFVKGYNDANKTVSELGAYDAETKKAGPLQGQAIVRSAQNLIRNLVFSTTAGGSGNIQRLSDIGISIDKSGALALDSSKLNKALEADYEGVTRLVEKVGNAFKTGLDSMTRSTGTISSVTDNVKNMIKGLGERGEILQARIARIEERYRAQFSALDTTIAGMKQTSSYLTQQLASLPGFG
ncbi:MAG: flagellar filament capping protein FliD [Azovibrio sp.]|uniref:flagellar filament capping protein FliD n=1 Tax=Azovibrio sp. TaxID=1872673 RepID=UPI003C70D86B